MLETLIYIKRSHEIATKNNVFTLRHSVREVRILTGRITEVGSKTSRRRRQRHRREKLAKHITRNHNV